MTSLTGLNDNLQSAAIITHVNNKHTTMPSVWKYINQRPSANQDGELYSCVADLYHEFRPRYPEELMNHAAAHIPVNGRILEIGSGPWNGNSSSIETRISSDVYRTKQWHDSKGKTCLS